MYFFKKLDIYVKYILKCMQFPDYVRINPYFTFVVKRLPIYIIKIGNQFGKLLTKFKKH